MRLVCMMYGMWEVMKSEFKSWVGEKCIVDFQRDLGEKAVQHFEQEKLTRQKMIITPDFVHMLEVSHKKS